MTTPLVHGLPLERFAYSNLPNLPGPPRGVALDFSGLGSAWMSEPGTRMDEYGADGILLLNPYLDPWNWMNDAAVRQTDAILDAVLQAFGLPEDFPVVSSGGSMGGLCALVWPCKTRHRVSAVVANCPVCDLPYHYGEREDLPRTLRAAFGTEPDFDAALRARSPLHLARAGAMPDVPYRLFHGTADRAVDPGKHSVPLAEALRAAGRDVTLELVPGQPHCALPAAWQARYAGAVRAACGAGTPD